MLGSRTMFYGLLLASFLIEAAAAQEVAITGPRNDQLTLADTVVVEGTGAPEGSTVTVTLNGATATASVVGGRWSVGSLPLQIGANTIEARIDTATTVALAVRGDQSIVARPPQKVRFKWSAGADDELKEVARGTLDAPLSDAQLEEFAAKVKVRVVEVFKEAYEGIADIRVVDAPGSDVHTISLLVVHGKRELYGSSPGDCGNEHPKQTSRVFVGQYRKSMTTKFDKWGPMRKDDALEVRIEDLGQAIGRTSAHELGHSLGLVRDATNSKCRWMDGCDKNHSCDAFDVNHQTANRFDNGRLIMDPGGKTRNKARLGEPSSKKRAAVRKPAVFDAFSASYLRILHPLP